MMERPGAEAESLLRQDGRGAVVMQRGGWDGLEGEKAPFLRNEPVKLTPAWEGSNLPNDTLNLKGITMDLAPPKDRWRIIYFTMVLHGLGTLTAWNMFITAKNYFVEYKLAGSEEHKANYLVYVGYASQMPNLLFSWFNVFVVLKGDLAKRIVWSLIIEVLIFVVTIVLAMVDSTDWTAAFFWITMLLVFVLNACNAVFQNSVFGVAAKLPQQYTGAVILGTNICGTAITLLEWASSSSGSLRTSAIYYFIGGMFVLLICFDTYFALPLNRFYRYHETLAERTARGNPALPASQAPKTSVPYWQLLKLTWVQLYNVWVVFFVSLSVFPAVHSQIFSMANPNRVKGVGFLGDNFMRITCFLTFNLFAMLGNITASLCQFPSRRWLAVFTTLRLAFIPLFLMCNYHPSGENMVRTMPIIINNDYGYWALAILLGWSSGHGSSLAMMYVGGNVPPEYASKAGMIGGAMLITGIMSGIAFSGLGPKIVTASFWSTT